MRGACVPGDTSESGLFAAGAIEVDAGITWLAAFPAIAARGGYVEGLRVGGSGSGGIVSIEESIAGEVGRWLLGFCVIYGVLVGEV